MIKTIKWLLRDYKGGVAAFFLVFVLVFKLDIVIAGMINLGGAKDSQLEDSELPYINHIVSDTVKQENNCEEVVSVDKLVVYEKKVGNDICIVKKNNKKLNYTNEMRIDKDKILSYSCKYEGEASVCYNCMKASIIIYNTENNKVEKKLDILPIIKSYYEPTGKSDWSIVKEFTQPIIGTTKDGKKIMIFEIPTKIYCDVEEDFDYFAYYIDEDKFEKIALDKINEKYVKTPGCVVFEDGRYNTVPERSALKSGEKYKRNFSINNYMNPDSFESLLDSNGIKYGTTELNENSYGPMRMTMVGNQIAKDSKFVSKFPELKNKYLSDDYEIEWYIKDEKNSDEVAKQLLPAGKKLNYDNVYIRNNCFKDCGDTRIKSLKEYFDSI
ncbi:hypothetical protein [Lachnobacterium bovis]|uniref:Uncharacterized protein n=1 Tax=Lachnobacterium bovis TaxID=140626 RepID=A0A1H9UWI6_9FIRM|nr:hypothetical protein [Lachnobacterium bovis]SES13393.1 hypothetical protein SAMN02910429_02275 [Lachnobacterium bovis]